MCRRAGDVSMSRLVPVVSLQTDRPDPTPPPPYQQQCIIRGNSVLRMSILVRVFLYSSIRGNVVLCIGQLRKECE